MTEANYLYSRLLKQVQLILLHIMVREVCELSNESRKELTTSMTIVYSARSEQNEQLALFMREISNVRDRLEWK
jgi:hypothetical protein